MLINLIVLPTVALLGFSLFNPSTWFKGTENKPVVSPYIESYAEKKVEEKITTTVPTSPKLKVSTTGKKTSLVPAKTSTSSVNETNLTKVVPKVIDTFSLAIIGTDQRFHDQKGFRTDVNLLLVMRPSVKKAVLVSAPRDLTINGRKINAIYPLQGLNAYKNVWAKISGVNVDRFVALGFDEFVWAVEQMNGLEVNVERNFIDSTYPGDRENWGPIKLEFQAGVQKMDGERALKYARSRKGTNGEGSDFARMKRQQNLILSMPEAFLNNRKVLIPFSAQALIDLITGRLKFDFKLEDVQKLYDFLADYKSWKIEKLVLDGNYVYTANAKDFGGAYTLLPKDSSYSSVKNFIAEKLQ